MVTAPATSCYHPSLVSLQDARICVLRSAYERPAGHLKRHRCKYQAPTRHQGWTFTYICHTHADKRKGRNTVSSNALAGSLAGGSGFSEDASQITWFQNIAPFSRMTAELCQELADAAQEVTVLPGQPLGSCAAAPEDLITVKSGHVKTLGGPSGTGSGPQQHGPGAILQHPLAAAVGDGGAPLADATAVGAVTLWRVSGASLWRITARHPELPALLLGNAAAEAAEPNGSVAEAAAEAAVDEAQRRQALQPYLVASPKRGVIGNSKYASRLRRQVIDAARDPNRGPVLIFGEPGLEKDNVAALVHFSSRLHAQPMVRVECARMDGVGSEVFGRGERRGLLDYIGEGSLLLNNLHQAPAALQPALEQLLTEGTYRAAATAALGASSPRPLMRSAARVLMTAENTIPTLSCHCAVIKVAPLRVRPADVAEYQRYFLREFARTRGLLRLTLTKEAVRQLESYKFPGNLTELEGMVARAAVQSGDAGREISEDVFWFATEVKDRFRIPLLKTNAWLRRLLRSDLWPERINFDFTVYVFAGLVALLFLGPQDRAHNFGLTLFWAYWWPVMFLVYPFLGRVWCAVCPFMIYGELMQRWRLSRGAVLLKWPKEAGDRYGPWFLFALFAAILVWEEVWDLPNSAALSSWLLLLITAGAVVCSAIFEKRFWCRYLCPIGGMNGMFAKLSATELRARQGICSGECSTYHCYKGGPAEPPEGLATAGCPIGSHPAQLTDNRNCVLCMDCLKACPHGSVEVRLRPPGIDLWTGHKPLAAEVALMFLLLGAVYLHHLPQVYQQLGLDPGATLDSTAAHIAASAVFLAAPGAACWAADGLMRFMAHRSVPAGTVAGGGNVAVAVAPMPSPFVELAYGYLPLVWAATLSHYLDLFLTEAGRILPVMAATVGLDGERWPLLPIVAHPAVTAFLQGSCLLGGAGASLLLTRKLGGRPWAVLAPQGAAVLLLTAELWALLE